jgi:ribonuclease HI
VGIVFSLDRLKWDIWTDGACANKTSGAGGYAAVLFARRSDGAAERWEVSGGAFETTNNQMELMAVITGLRALPPRARVCVHIDSTYVKRNFEERLKRWQDNGWLTADGKPVKNRDLWKQLSTEADRRKVDWVKVDGHTGDEWNEYADKLACAEKDAYDERSRRLGLDPAQTVTKMGPANNPWRDSSGDPKQVITQAHDEV